jgi:type I restriction enzyme, S subunit
MDKMKYERLGNIVTITSGGTPLTSNREYYVNGNIPWVKTGDLKVKYLTETPEKITRLGIKNSSAKIFPINTVLVAMYGATIGACSILKTEASTNQACAALLPNKSLDHEYLYYCLRSIKSKLIEKGIGGGQPNISATILKNTKIPFPVFEDQIRIATILSKVDELLKQRKESIALLDEFLKSKFLEMFGDPIRNEKRWEKKRLAKILKIKHGFAFKSEYFSNKGEYKLLTPMNFNEEGGYVEKKDKQKYYVGSFSEDYILEENNLLVAMTEQAHGLLGSVIKVPNNGIFLHNQRLGLVVFDKNKLSTNFLFYLFNSLFVRKIIDSKATGTKVRHTSPSKIEEISVGIPDFTLQTQFAQIVEKTEALKKQYQASLEELEQLFSSLSQKAFKGELDLSKVEIEKEKHSIKGIKWSKIEQDSIALSQKITSNTSLPDDYVRREWKDKIEYEEILAWENKPYFHETEKVRNLIRFVGETYQRFFRPTLL